MQSLEAACEEVERSIKRFKSNRSSLPLPRVQEQATSSPVSAPYEAVDGNSNKPPFDIFAKLKEIYQESNETADSGSKYNTILLEKLVVNERLNTLIVNLYPENEGYSLGFRAPSCIGPNHSDDSCSANMIETKTWLYEADELINYINNEELPPFILDLLEPHFSYLFYSGCIIAEIRDYRQQFPQNKYSTQYVLLRPTLRSLLEDISNMVEEKSDWGIEEKEQIESQLLMANEPTLFLDPKNTLYNRVTELNNQKHIWNTYTFRQLAKKRSRKTVNRKRELDQFTHRPKFELYNYIKAKVEEEKRKIRKKSPEDVINKPMPVPNLEPPVINPPSADVIVNGYRTYARPEETSDCLPQLIEEYVLETDMPSKDRDKPRVYHIKLSILQRPSNSEYLGELYLDRDHKKNEQNGVACKFSLGSRANATRYIHQFTEIFKESGRKSARIRYGLSPGYKEKVASQQQANAQNVAATQQNSQHAGQETQNPTNSASPVVNGNIMGTVTVKTQQPPQTVTVPVVQGTDQPNREQAINALATKLMNSAQEFQAAASAKQQQQQKLSGSNTAIINLLNSSPASNVNSDASAAVVNAINNTPLLPQQIQTINWKLIQHKMTIQNARVLNHGNLITLNNNRLQDVQQQTPQNISINSANYANFTTVPVKQQRLVTNSENKSAHSAMIMGTSAADRPEIVETNANSLLLKKLAGSTSNSQQPTHFIQTSKPSQQFMVQSPKNTTPLSSPSVQGSNTINVQSLNFTQLQSIPGLQNLQVQLPGFALSLNVSSTGNIQGHPTSLIVSLPVTTTDPSSTTETPSQEGGDSSVNSLGLGQTVVLANASTSNLDATQVNLPQLQQYQQICLNQTTNNIIGKIRRKSSNSESQ